MKMQLQYRVSGPLAPKGTKGPIKEIERISISRPAAGVTAGFVASLCLAGPEGPRIINEGPPKGGPNCGHMQVPARAC